LSKRGGAARPRLPHPHSAECPQRGVLVQRVNCRRSRRRNRIPGSARAGFPGTPAPAQASATAGPACPARYRCGGAGRHPAGRRLGDLAGVLRGLGIPVPGIRHRRRATPADLNSINSPLVQPNPAAANSAGSSPARGGGRSRPAAFTEHADRRRPADGRRMGRWRSGSTRPARHSQG